MPMTAMDSFLPSSAPLPLSGDSARAARNMASLVKALELGIEIGISGAWLRLFQSGDVIRTPRGYFEVDEPRLMCRVVKGPGNDSVYTDNAFQNDFEIWAWLEHQAGLLSDECISKVAAACEIHALSRPCVDGQGSSRPDARVNNVISLHDARQFR